MIFSMIAMYGAVPSASAVSFTSAKVTLSDSDLGVSATSTATINMGDTNYLVGGEYIRFTFDSNWTTPPDASRITCPTGSTASATPAAYMVDCVVDAGEFVEATSTQDVVIAPLTTPGSESLTGYTIVITTYTAGSVEKEKANVKVYIIDDVLVSATVDASLAFDIAGIAAYSGNVNGTTTEITTNSTSIPFGTLTVGSTTVAAQRISVTTNAASGFSVTVQQDGELRNGVGANINSFNNAPTGQGSTTPLAWVIPSSTLGTDRTYGHMGITSSDGSLDGTVEDTDPFDSDEWAGLNGVSPMQVMYHSGPANGLGGTEGVGWADVGYAVEISALQEAGDYTSSITYVCTPTY
jgi:hypothetical protein